MVQLRLFQRTCRMVERRQYSSSAGGRKSSAIMFPGQGTQKVGMTAPLLKGFPSTKYVLDEIDAKLGFRLSELILRGPPDELIKTENAQPAIVATSCCILYILQKELGVKLTNHINYVLGHSLGEFTSLVAAGIMTAPDVALLVHERGKSMALAINSLSEEGQMIALVVEKGRIPELVKDIEDFSKQLCRGVCQIANINSSDQLVLSGTRKALSECLSHLCQLSGYDPRVISLPTAGPFHTKLMYPAVKVVSDLLDKIPMLPPIVPLVMNATAKPETDISIIKRNLAQQAVKPVLWWKSIEYLHSQDTERYLAIGPGNVIRNLACRQVGRTKVIGCTTIEEIIELGATLSKTYQSK